MYDVKQVDPSEWSSPRLRRAKLVDKPGAGKVIVGRGAVNQKGPEAPSSPRGTRSGAQPQLPVNLVLVAEGEEEIGSPHFPQVGAQAGSEQALSKCEGHLHALCRARARRQGQHQLGAKGIIGMASWWSEAKKWGRGPARDIHSSLRAS